MADGRDRNRRALPQTPLHVAVYPIHGHHRSELCCQVMAEGARRCGERVSVIDERRWDGELQGDVAVFYGLEGNTPALFEHYRIHAKAVYVDLGYWGRRQGGRWTGYHKVVVNDRHPTAYFRNVEHPPDRLAMFHVEPKPWRAGLQDAPILLAGMSDKGAIASGHEPEQWERDTLQEIRRYTARPVIYRPKPSWKEARPIPGMGYSPRTQTTEAALRDAWAVVTRHSNIAIEAVLAGVPAFATHGVGAVLSCPDLRFIEQPHYPSAALRGQVAADIAYCQWSIAEMREGLAWRHLRAEGLL